MGSFNYHRRRSIETEVGNLPLGGENPIRVQSMTNTSTMDTENSVAQIQRMAESGCEYARLTAQGVREASNLAEIKKELRQRDIDIPLIADIHFNPKAAFEAALHVEKVRINPGNFVDPGRTFRQIDYTPEEYQNELNRIDQTLIPFLELCKEHSTAVRIGVNHGSLSDRIMSRYGNTPAGMVESAMEFLRVCKKTGFRNVVISMKASNTVVMVEAVRRLVREMDKEEMNFPLHLGVTEAGAGEDGRIKSAVGIGTLLAEGVGDTVRVSLSEPPEAEIPVAKSLVDYISSRKDAPEINGEVWENYDPINPNIPLSEPYDGIGGNNRSIVVVEAEEWDDTYPADRKPDKMVGKDWTRIDSAAIPDAEELRKSDTPLLLTSSHADPVGEMKAALHKIVSEGIRRPVILSLSYNNLPENDVKIRAAADFGALLLSGFGDGIMICGDSMTAAGRVNLAFNILQASRRRFTRTEFISCPGCGRTLFELETTVQKIKEATSHLKALKLGIMGCIVNGPGEMADADYGYVGAAAGHVSLYRGKECIEKNIPEDQALHKLIELLKNDGVWEEPEK